MIRIETPMASSLMQKLQKSPIVLDLTGMAIILLSLEVAGMLGLLPTSVPVPSAISAYMLTHFMELQSHLVATAKGAAVGFVGGTVVAIGLALLTHLSVRLGIVVRTTAMTIHAIPLIAMSPLLVIWLGTGFAALAAFFPVMVATM